MVKPETPLAVIAVIATLITYINTKQPSGGQHLKLVVLSNVHGVCAECPHRVCQAASALCTVW